MFIQTVRSRMIVRGLLILASLFMTGQQGLAGERLHLSWDSEADRDGAQAPGGKLVPGRFGRGLAVSPGQTVAIPLPVDIPPHAGMVECWISANDWDAAQAGGVTLLSLVFADGDGWVLDKPADTAVLRLSLGGKVVAESPVYDWYPRDWAKGRDAAHGWRFVSVAWEAGQASLFVDGARAPSGTGAPTEARTPAGDKPGLIIGGGANPVVVTFDDLRLHDAPLPSDKMEDRYLVCYHNEFDFRPQHMTATFAEAPPRIDGRLDEAVWRQAAAIIGFSEAGKREIIRDIRVACLYDNQHLYVGFSVPFAGPLEGNRDSPRDTHKQALDNVEIFLDPSQELEPAYYQLAGNVFGAILDNRAMDFSWDPDWEWKTDVGDGVWTGEARIPFSDLERDSPSDGHVWNVNFTAAKPWAHWSLTWPFHSRRQFGRLVFDRRLPVVRIDRIDAGTPGKLSVAYTVANRTDKPIIASAALQVVPPGSITATQARETGAETLPPGREHTRTLELDLPDNLKKAEYVFSVASGDRIVSYQRFAFDHQNAQPSPAADQDAASAKTKDAAKATVSAEAKRWPAQVLGEEVLLREVWEGNTLGVSDETLPPWPPIETTNGILRVWGRDIRAGDGILPQSIVALGEELLAAPIRLTARRNGRQSLLVKNREGAPDMTHRGSGKVEYATSGSLDGLEVACRQTIEFDGMLRVDLTVSPGTDAGAALDELALEIPMRSEMARYYHVIGSTGHPPDTDVGELPAGGFARGFVPLVWLGTEQRGVAWFAEDFRDWHFTDRHGWIEVMPDGEAITLRVRFVSAPLTIDGARRFTFGLQATPMRPRPEGWRNWHFDNRGDGADGAMSWLWFWGPTSYCFSHDLGIVAEWVAGSRARGRPVLPISSYMYYASYYLNHGQRGMPPHPKDGMITPEYKLWGREWALETGPPPLAVPKDHYRARYSLAKACIASSYQDYYVYVVNRMIEKAGIDGLYLDQPLKACGNAAHGCGYTDAQGVRQARFLIFPAREAMKRLRRIFHERHGYTRLQLHMSNQLLVPVLSLADIYFDGENYNSGPLRVYDHYSEVIPLPRYRIQHSLQAFGPAPMLMTQFPPRSRRRETTREFFGYNLLHDGLAHPLFGCVTGEASAIMKTWREFAGRDNVAHHPYWENGGLLTVAPDTVKVSFYRQTDALLFVVVNTDAQSMITAALALAAGSRELGDRPMGAATDAFTGAPVAVDGRTLRVPVRGNDFRLIKLNLEK